MLMLLGIRIYSVSAILSSWLFLLFAVPVYRQLARLVLRKAGLWTIPVALIGESQKLARIHAVRVGFPTTAVIFTS